MAAMMMSCDKATYLVSRSQEEKLSLRQRMELKIHLISCNLCRRYEKEIKALNTYLKKEADHCCSHHKLENSQKEKIQKRIVDELS